MIEYSFTKQAYRSFTKLPDEIQQRIKDKLIYLKESSNIFVHLTKLTDLPPANHRLRVGQYRLLLFVQQKTKLKFDVLIVELDHRKDIYR